MKIKNDKIIFMSTRASFIQTKQEISLTKDGKINKNFSTSVNTMIKYIDFIDNFNFEKEQENIIGELNLLDINTNDIKKISDDRIDKTVITNLKNLKVNMQLIERVKSINKYRIYNRKNYRYIILIDNPNNGKHILEMREDLSNLFTKDFRVIYVKEIAQRNQKDTKFILKKIMELEKFKNDDILKTQELIESYDKQGINDFFTYPKEICINEIENVIHNQFTAKKLYSMILNKINFIDKTIKDETVNPSIVFEAIEQFINNEIGKHTDNDLKKLYEYRLKNLITKYEKTIIVKENNTEVKKKINTFFENSKQTCINKFNEITDNNQILASKIYTKLFENITSLENHTSPYQINTKINAELKASETLKKSLEILESEIKDSFQNCSLLFIDQYKDEIEEIRLLHTHRDESETEEDYNIYEDRLCEKELRLKEYQKQHFFPNSIYCFNLLYDVIGEYADIRIFGDGKYERQSTQIIKYYQHKIKNIKKYNGEYDHYIHNRNNRLALVRKIEYYDKFIFSNRHLINIIFNPLSYPIDNDYLVYVSEEEEDIDDFTLHLKDFLLSQYQKDSIEYKKISEKIYKIEQLINILFPKTIVTEDKDVGSLFGDFL